MERGFFSSLFDLSFTSFITTKIIKVIYVLTLIGIGFLALYFIDRAFKHSAGLGLFVLIFGAPIGAVFYAVYARVILEFIVQIFRIGELLRDQNELQRTAFAAAGWLPDNSTPVLAPEFAFAPTGPASASAPTVPPMSAAAPAAPEGCPHCGAPTAPGAQFCRSCGQKLT